MNKEYQQVANHQLEMHSKLENLEKEFSEKSRSFRKLQEEQTKLEAQVGF